MLKKFKQKKKYLNFLPVTPLRLELGLLKEKDRGFSILRAFVLQKKLEVLTNHLQFEKFHSEKVLKGHLRYIVRL